MIRRNTSTPQSTTTVGRRVNESTRSTEVSRATPSTPKPPVVKK